MALLNNLILSHVKCIAAYNNDKMINTKIINDDENSVESMPLQSRLKEIGMVTRRSTRLLTSTVKPEPEHKMILLTRKIDRAVSLPLERKSQQLLDFNIDGKERGHSVQRDQVRFLYAIYYILMYYVLIIFINI